MSEAGLYTADLTLERVRRLEGKVDQLLDKMETLMSKVDAAIDMHDRKSGLVH
jgi:outer membrane murein-binding lipoprotein Lpp